MSAHGADIMFSNDNGNWNAPESWTPPGVPVAENDYFVSAGSSIRTDTSGAGASSTFSGGSLTVRGQLTLRAPDGGFSAANLTLENGGVIVNAIGSSTQVLEGVLHFGAGANYVKSTGTTETAVPSGGGRNIVINSAVTGGADATAHFLRRGLFTLNHAGNPFSGTWKVGGSATVPGLDGGPAPVSNNANNVSTLKAAAEGSLGADANVVVDLWSRFEADYNWTTAGSLTLVNNNGLAAAVVLTLNRNISVGTLTVAGNSFAPGTYDHDSFAAAGFGDYFTNGGGRIIVGGGGGPDPEPPPPFPGAGPGLRLILDSVVTPNGWNFDTGDFGTSINGQTFQQEALVSFNGWQYAACFDASRRPSLGRRKLPDGPWETIVFTGYTAANHKDNHNVNVVGICPEDGTIHLSYDHHNSTLHYRRSVPGVATNPENFTWTQSNFGPHSNSLLADQPSITGVTYPQFFTSPNGRLQFCFRIGKSGDGDWHLYEYSAAGWEYLGMLFGRGGGVYAPSGSSVRSAYPNQFRYGRDGRLHITWSWREANSNLNGNHDLGYARSDDFGRTWKNSAGETMAELNGEADAANSIRHTTSGNIVYPIKYNWGYMNTTTQAVDSKGRVHVIAWRTPDDGTFSSPVNLNDWRYFHYWRDTDGIWRERQLPFFGRKPQAVLDDAGNMYVIFGSADDRRYHTTDPGWRLAFATATEASGWTDWSDVREVTDRTYHGEPLLDTGRWERERILSVYVQEKPAVAGAASPLRVLDLEPKSERELWDEAQFGEAASDPLVAGDEAAPAGDGIVNLVKYAFGMHALDPEGMERMPELMAAEIDEEAYLAINFQRRISPFSGVAYGVLGSEDLVDWVPVDTAGHLAGLLADTGDGFERVTMHAPAPISLQPRYFLKLKLLRAEARLN